MSDEERNERLSKSKIWRSSRVLNYSLAQQELISDGFNQTAQKERLASGLTPVISVEVIEEKEKHKPL